MIEIEKKQDDTLGFRNLMWKSKEMYIPLRKMTYTHLLQVMKTVREIGLEYQNNVCGQTKEIWLTAIKKELAYRDKLANKVLFQFKNMPDLINAAERGFFKDKQGRLVKMAD